MSQTLASGTPAQPHTHDDHDPRQPTPTHQTSFGFDKLNQRWRRTEAWLTDVVSADRSLLDHPVVMACQVFGGGSS